MTQVFVKSEGNKHSLWIKTEMSSENPAGWRLKRGGKFPISDFVFDSESEAEEAREQLEIYLKDPRSFDEQRKKLKNRYESEQRSIFGT